MNTAFRSPGFPAGGPESWPAAARDAFEQFRGQFERKVGARMGRGDVRAAVLRLLRESPMHGYQIIHEIAERSGGSWKPSPGSVYPTLQLLVDEGIIRAIESDGRKTYELTAEGQAVAGTDADTPAPWESSFEAPARAHTALAKAGFELARAAAEVGRTGTPEQLDRAVELLNETRRRLHGIIAQD